MMARTPSSSKPETSSCFFKVAKENGKPWQWWDYVTDFSIRCPMKESKYTKECSDRVIKSIGYQVRKIDHCIGDIEADIGLGLIRAIQEQVQVILTRKKNQVQVGEFEKVVIDDSIR